MRVAVELRVGEVVPSVPLTVTVGLEVRVSVVEWVALTVFDSVVDSVKVPV